MLTEWLQPIAEKKYIRVLYIGKLVLGAHEGPIDKSENGTSPKRLENMLDDIWKQASAFNRSNFISGHLSCAKSLHVVQVLEGKEKVVLSLMDRIRNDPRVIIDKEFTKKQLTMHQGWGISMSYSFEITSAQLSLIQEENLTMEEMFHMMKNTYEVEEEGHNLRIFYKDTIETFLLKYISITEGKGAEY